jgi:hypothetical protein
VLPTVAGAVDRDERLPDPVAGTAREGLHDPDVGPVGALLEGASRMCLDGSLLTAGGSAGGLAFPDLVLDAVHGEHDWAGSVIGREHWVFAGFGLRAAGVRRHLGHVGTGSALPVIWSENKTLAGRAFSAHTDHA